MKENEHSHQSHKTNAMEHSPRQLRTATNLKDINGKKGPVNGMTSFAKKDKTSLFSTLTIDNVQKTKDMLDQNYLLPSENNEEYSGNSNIFGTTREESRVQERREEDSIVLGSISSESTLNKVR